MGSSPTTRIHGCIAQLAEHRTLNPQVEGSIPSAPIRAISHEVALFFLPAASGAGTRPIPLALHTGSIRAHGQQTLYKYMAEPKSLTRGPLFD